jgi:hypothetical protein
MGALIVLITMILLIIIVLALSAPLRRAHTDQPQLAELEGLKAAREAKYREIRDAELDWRTGKLSNEDYRTIDQTLRAQAFEILQRIEQLERSLPA